MIWLEINLQAWNCHVGKRVIRRRFLGVWSWTPIIIARTRKRFSQKRVRP